MGLHKDIRKKVKDLNWVMFDETSKQEIWGPPDFEDMRLALPAHSNNNIQSRHLRNILSTIDRTERDAEKIRAAMREEALEEKKPKKPAFDFMGLFQARQLSEPMGVDPATVASGARSGYKVQKKWFITRVEISDWLRDVFELPDRQTKYLYRICPFEDQEDYKSRWKADLARMEAEYMAGATAEEVRTAIEPEPELELVEDEIDDVEARIAAIEAAADDLLDEHMAKHTAELEQVREDLGAVIAEKQAEIEKLRQALEASGANDLKYQAAVDQITEMADKIAAAEKAKKSLRKSLEHHKQNAQKAMQEKARLSMKLQQVPVESSAELEQLVLRLIRNAEVDEESGRRFIDTQGYVELLETMLTLKFGG